MIHPLLAPFSFNPCLLMRTSIHSLGQTHILPLHQDWREFHFLIVLLGVRLEYWDLLVVRFGPLVKAFVLFCSYKRFLVLLNNDWRRVERKGSLPFIFMANHFVEKEEEQKKKVHKRVWPCWLVYYCFWFQLYSPYLIT